MKKKLINGLIVTTIFLIIGIYYTQPTNTVNESSTDQLEVIEVKGKVLAVDNSDVITANISSIGFQQLVVEVMSGDYKGEVFETTNSLNGQLDFDNLYAVGDYILLAIQLREDEVYHTKPIDQYRQTWLLILFLFFVVVLLLYSGIIGINALLSFLLSLIILWEFFIKGLLKGYNPLLLTVLTVILLSAIIIFLVAGLTKKGFSAFISTIFGLFITLILTHFFGNKIGMYGLTQSYVQALILSSGNYSLDIQQIYYAAVVLGASGAAMDISMDIAASMDEIKNKKPTISLKELIQSGITVGRHVIGTMSTTLLLAYSGSYLTLLMLFQVQNSSFMRIINLKLVSAEIMRTLIGSTGLILVAPLTAITTGLILSNKRPFSKKDSNLSLD
jgi:uncharacterized membrane protein